MTHVMVDAQHSWTIDGHAHEDLGRQSSNASFLLYVWQVPQAWLLPQHVSKGESQGFVFLKVLQKAKAADALGLSPEGTVVHIPKRNSHSLLDSLAVQGSIQLSSTRKTLAALQKLGI